MWGSPHSCHTQTQKRSHTDTAHVLFCTQTHSSCRLHSVLGTLYRLHRENGKCFSGASIPFSCFLNRTEVHQFYLNEAHVPLCLLSGLPLQKDPWEGSTSLVIGCGLSLSSGHKITRRRHCKAWSCAYEVAGDQNRSDLSVKGHQEGARLRRS